MCSIFCIFNNQRKVSDLRSTAVQLSAKMRHRGPDWSGVYENTHAILVHERLSIVDIEHGAQPLYAPNPNDHESKLVLAVNGEIYNHKSLEKSLKNPFNFTTHSDCEVILALFRENGLEFLNLLQGMFAFALYDEFKKTLFVARDPLGIIPLYIGYDKHDNVYVASEMKAIISECEYVEIFPPGCYAVFGANQTIKKDLNQPFEYFKYYQKEWTNASWLEMDSNQMIIKDEKTAIKSIHDALSEAVKTHLMTDVPYGVLLSGGLDSSIIAAITKRFVDFRIEDDDQTQAWWPRLHTFSVGLEGAPDLEAAKKVAEHLQTVHHAITYTIQEGIDAVEQVIYSLETYDITTIRASVPMYLMARKIRSMGIKMVLSGEGSDELFGGYLYFHKAPTPRDFHEETVRKLQKLHKYDCLRANKSMMAWSVEARVPFLDRNFIDTAMSIDPKLKMITSDRMEKYLLRKAFSDYLPESVTWRQKEQFSDGVGYSWIDHLQAHAESTINDKIFLNASKRFPINTPETKEAYWYRELFERHFSKKSAIMTVDGGKSVACSTPIALQWDESLKNCIDPSGRAVKNVHNYSDGDQF